MLTAASREPFALSSGFRDAFAAPLALLYVLEGYWDYGYSEELIAGARTDLALSGRARVALTLTNADRDAFSLTAALRDSL